MASICRSPLLSRARSVASHSKTLFPSMSAAKPSPPAACISSASSVPRASRVLSALGSVESLMPLHSAVASARLKSTLARDSSCWSWLSQGLALPL